MLGKGEDPAFVFRGLSYWSSMNCIVLGIKLSLATCKVGVLILYYFLATTKHFYNRIKSKGKGSTAKLFIENSLKTEGASNPPRL